MNKTGRTYRQAKLGESLIGNLYRSVGTRGASLKLSDLTLGVSDYTGDTSKQTEPLLAPLSSDPSKAGTKVSLVFCHDHFSESFSHYVAISPTEQNQKLLQKTMEVILCSVAWGAIREFIKKKKLHDSSKH